MSEHFLGFFLLICTFFFFRQVYLLRFGGASEPAWLPKHGVFQYPFIIFTWIGAGLFCFGGFFACWCLVELALDGRISQLELRSDTGGMAAAFSFVVGPGFSVLLDTTIREKEKQALLIKHLMNKHVQ